MAKMSAAAVQAVTIAMSASVIPIPALTASERRVAQLALENLSNKDIAQTLFVTVKTVEFHLGRVYRKLGIGSRHQLTTELLGTDRPQV
jgi:DNA-binding CsgD family transcriptional regulator